MVPSPGFIVEYDMQDIVAIAALRRSGGNLRQALFCGGFGRR
jgi:hypothetical protein